MIGTARGGFVRNARVAALAALLAFTLDGCAGTSTSPTPSGAPGALTNNPLLPCSSGAPLFDTLPIDTSDFLGFRPLGFLSPPIHMFPAKHSAFSMTPPGAVASARPVRAPGRILVKEIWEASFSSGGRNYQVYVYPCTDVRVYFGHLASLADRLAVEMQKVPASCNTFADGTGLVTTCRHENMSVALESGEPLGAGPDSAGVDFGVVDFRRSPAAFIRLDHYDHFYPYYASPLDYFRADVRAALAARTGHVFGTVMRTAEPVGGTYMQDVGGSAQGNWFIPGTYHSNSTDLGRSLGLASDYVDPGQPLMAIGTSIAGMTMGLYSFNVAGQGFTNRAFRDVRADGATYCYEAFLQGQSTGGLPLTRPGGVVIMAMPDDNALRVELVPGSTCAAAERTFTMLATRFER